MKVMVRNYFFYESEEILYDLERMNKRGYELKKVIQNIYIFEQSSKKSKYFVYQKTKPGEFETVHKRLTNDQWSLVDSNRNWAIYKTQQQNWDSGCNPCFLKNEIVKNIIYELLVFFSILVGWIQYKGVQSSHDRYRILPNKNIPTLFQAIELLGYILLAIALVYLIIEIINAYKNQYKTALRHPVIRKIFNFANILLLSTCICLICIATILFVTQSKLYSVITFGLVIYWVILYILLGGSFGVVNTLTIIAGTTFFILEMCIIL